MITLVNLSQIDWDYSINAFTAIEKIFSFFIYDIIALIEHERRYLLII